MKLNEANNWMICYPELSF